MKKEMEAKEEMKEPMEQSKVLEIAVEKGNAEITKMLIELEEQRKKQTAKEEFFKALSSFQSSLEPIKKTKIVRNKDGTIRYFYATYDDIIEAIKPMLEKYGFSYHFKTEFEDKAVIVECVITHSLGHQEITKFKAPIEASVSEKEKRMLPIQEWGAALTYAKRYSLSLGLGLATEEDTDANLEISSPFVPGTHEKKEPIVPPPGSKEKPPGGSHEEKKADWQSEEISQPQINLILGLLKKRGVEKDIIETIIGKKIERLEELTKGEASKVITELNKEPF